MKKVFTKKFLKLEVETHVEDGEIIKIFTIVIDDGATISLTDLEFEQLKEIMDEQNLVGA